MSRDSESSALDGESAGSKQSAEPRSAPARWLKKMMPLSRQVAIAAAVAPEKSWFRVALAASRLQGRAAHAMGGNGALTEMAMLEHWLREFTHCGRFPIPMRIYGLDALDEYVAHGPVMYYTLHLAMSDMPLRALVERGYPVPVPIADSGRMVGGDRYPVTGLNVRIPTLAAGPHVLQRVRTLLRTGGSIACMADRGHLDNALYANPLRLAGRLHVPVIFMWATLAADGKVDVTFRPAPHPFCESEAAVQANLDVVRELQDGFLRALGLAPVVQVPILRPAQAKEPVAETPLHSQAA